jgi:hypothetical protein
MNPKLKELAEQAGYLPDMFGIGHWDMPECQKFAELIVRECANVANSGIDPDESHLIGNDILEHFGVEE